MNYPKKAEKALPFLFVALLLILIGYQLSTGKSEQPEEKVQKTFESEVVDSNCLDAKRWVYGFDMSQYTVRKEKMKKNEFLADILLPAGVNYQQIVELERRSKKVYPTRSFVAGNYYQIYFKDDSAATPAYFVYEIDPLQFVVYGLNNDTAYLGRKKSYKIRRTASGIIHSSLYETLMEEGLSPVLAIEMSEVYAWSIDFYRLQKNDRFKIIYYDTYIDGQRVGIHSIESCLFEHMNEEYYAFYFNPDSTMIGDYFDECGNSLRKALLKSPIKFGRISSRYSKNRFHPILKRNKPHLGTDYAAPHGTPIMSVGDGTVIVARYKRNNGNYVKIRHNSTYTTQYLHMSKFGNGIREGVKVKQGQIIGYIGSTGLATGPHVCYRFWKNGVQVDPMKEKIPPSKPVKAKYFNEYFELVERNLRALGEIHFRKSV